MDPRTTVIGLANECWVSRCLHAAALFGVADAIGEDGITVEELASSISVDTRLLHVVLRILSGRGIFSCAHDIVSHTDASRLLRADHPATVSHIVKWSASDESWRALGELPRLGHEGISGFQSAYGVRLFDHLSSSPAASETFMHSMDGFTRKQVSSILATLDFANYRKIVDVGGGMGLLARAIAQQYPSKEVMLFDLPGVVATLPDGDGSIGVKAGDFFVDPIPTADLAILMNVLHDWTDDEILKILAAVRQSLKPDGRLLIIEGLVAQGKNGIDLLDLGMVIMTGGRQRSRAEYDALLALAGFGIEDEVECSEHLSALAAAPTSDRHALEFSDSLCLTM